MAGVLFCVAMAGCSQIDRPKVEPFYATSVPPPKQELRWSNGKTPASFDPALAAAPPETDLIRAIYEGLTELDSRSLRAAPGVAESWRSSNENRTWTFSLRKDARWSNGEPVTANDFVRSWKRLAELGERSANDYLFQNIVGMPHASAATPGEMPADFLKAPSPETVPSAQPGGSGRISPRSQLTLIRPTPSPNTVQPMPDARTGRSQKPEFGVTAVDDHTLSVELYRPDADFPKLVSHPIFRPVYGDGSNFEKDPKDPSAPTNGAFRITAVEDGSIALSRSETYWNSRSVALESVRFIAAVTAENALEAYRAGEVDVVTNTALEPVGAKLLAPFDDFKKTAHNAVNFYEVNTENPPYSDRRVRQALALSIDREKLTEGDLQGMTYPAYTFSPLHPKRGDSLNLDVNKAIDLLEKAGYPEGAGFPPIRLVVNRNDVQQRVANSVARMWKQNLNLDTVIVVKETSEIDEIRRSRDYDLIRRGVVMRTNDIFANLSAIHGAPRPADSDAASTSQPAQPPKSLLEEEILTPSPLGDILQGDETAEDDPEPPASFTSEAALFELTAIPLYFPASYSLVKPYVRGFELNGLDAPSLKEVSIDNEWQP